MPRIYTMTGDDGTTGLIGGKRLYKDALRVEAYGSVDELNAVLGVARACRLPSRADEILAQVQDELFTIGANLAVPEGTNPAEWKIPPIDAESVRRLERTIDEVEAGLQPLQNFILPGGTMAAAMLHVARTVARRAERACVALTHSEKLEPQIISYLNRISDLCFVMARAASKEGGQPESHPTFGR